MTDVWVVVVTIMLMGIVIDVVIITEMVTIMLGVMIPEVVIVSLDDGSLDFGRCYACRRAKGA